MIEDSFLVTPATSKKSSGILPRDYIARNNADLQSIILGLTPEIKGNYEVLN